MSQAIQFSNTSTDISETKIVTDIAHLNRADIAALRKWIDDYDLSPRHTPAVIELALILQNLVPHKDWPTLLKIILDC